MAVELRNGFQRQASHSETKSETRLFSCGMDSKDRLHVLKLSLKPGSFRVCESQENPPAMVCVTQQFYRRFQTIPCHHIQLQLELSQQLLGGVF